MQRARSNRPFVGIVRDQAGQSLVLALMILFMLVFIGGLFVTLIVKNMGRAQRSGETMSADYLAETGLRYACDQLTYSLDGADWRPSPNYPEQVIWWEHRNDIAPPPEPVPPAAPYPGDPDYQWLRQGFCRFTYGNGRFLIRVSYDPKYGDPTSKYIKIEAIGRPGVVDESDPTTLQIRQPARLRSEKVAYKAIGITDYSRFITNLDRRTEPFALGVPAYTSPDGLVKKPFVMQYGELSDINGDGNPEPHGGSIRVNGNLKWYGQNFLWLDQARNDAVEVAGDITHSVEWNRSGSTIPPDATAVFVNTPGFGITDLLSSMARQSSDPAFDTYPGNPTADVGVYRDGSGNTDIVGAPSGRPRSIKRLEPPLIDITAPGGGAGRYRELTRNSGEWRSTSNGWYNTGYYGWGAGLYIDNREDIQPESELRTLRDDWMTPGGSQYWAGPYYTPPGVVIILTPFDLDNGRGPKDPITKHADMILMETNASGAKFNWHDANGNILTPTAGQLIMPYPKNGVIFAEGNIRIKGTLPPHTNLTVVSGGTIYVEGNILKSNVDDYGEPLQSDDGNLVRPTDPRDSSISLLATDNVCVNTTQFFGPAPESQTSGNWRPDLSCYAATVDHPLTFNFAFGEDPTWAYYDNGNQCPIGVYVRHTADNGPSYMTMTLNQAGVGGDPWYGLYSFGEGLLPWSTLTPPVAPSRQYIYPLADPDAMASLSPDVLTQSQILAEQRYPMWEHQVFTIFPLKPVGKNTIQRYDLNIFPGANNLVTLGLDQNMARSDYLLSRFAVQPSDICIEALMYAQNGSFYVIPGEWFNPDPSDSREEELSPNAATNYKGRGRRACIDKRWPYYGDPLDVQITIYGAVSENVSAPLADEASWMDKWGWIPPVHGSPEINDRTVGYRSPLDPRDNENETMENGMIARIIRQRGFSIIYDNQLSYPRVPDSDHPLDRKLDIPIRRDDYGRILPITPKLPVSAQTLYFGTPA